ncbi:hypothetical protein HID58_087299 [Brassica napus]|uniref:DUF4283 domain-containing protein n=1 Tax=Brassica napus TaxID=3708 RepID=A0ABQ7XSY1_BRANA|nr:hypothetical protein HID58_087299 [Brassica napus]
MARKFTASKKAKGPAGSSAHVRRIQIPPTDNSALIEMNKLTLIGRVTNPEMQNTRALVDFFLQHWQVAGTITGCDLGPYLFQFSFDLERDLQSILLRGHVEVKDVPKGRIRLAINGLELAIKSTVNTIVSDTLALWENGMTELKGETSLITIRGALKYLPILPPTELNFHRLRDRPAHSLSLQIPLSQVSHTPSLTPLKEPMQPVSAAASGSMNVSSDRRSALERLAPAKDRLFALERLSPAGSYNGSQERCSALACIYLPSDREPLPQLERLSPAGTFEIRYFEETMPDVPFADGMGASDVHVDILYSSCNIIDTFVKSKTFSFYVSFIYGTQKKEDRPAFWSKLVELGKAREDAWLLTGDFNDLLDNEEKVGGPLRWEGSFLAVGPNFGQYINGPRSKA